MTAVKNMLARHAHRSPIARLVRGLPPLENAAAAAITTAKLPAPIDHLLRRVVHTTGLWPKEQHAIALELADHFKEGLGSGAAPESLIQNFGDPTTAAKLLRKAAKRKRPPLYHIAALGAKASLAAVAAILLIYAGLYVSYVASSPTINRNLAAELNAQDLATPEADRAWPLYRQASIEHNATPIRELLTPPAHSIFGTPGHDPNNPYMVEIRDILLSRENVLQTVHAAADKPRMGHILNGDNDSTTDASENPVLFEVMLPQMSSLRSLARLLLHDAEFAADDNQPDRFLRNIKSFRAMARHANQDPLIISHIVALSIDSLAMNLVRRTLHTHPNLLTTDQLTALAHQIAASPLNPDLTGERAMFDDIMQRAFTDDGKGGGTLTPEGYKLLFVELQSVEPPTDFGPVPDSTEALQSAFAPIAPRIVRNRSEIARRYHTAIDEAQLRLTLEAQGTLTSADQYPMLTNIETPSRPNQLDDIRDVPLNLFLPNINRAARSVRTAHFDRELTLATIAIAAHTKRFAGPPKSMDTLIPTFIAAPPIHPDSNRPIRYALIAGTPTLYDIGPDADHDNAAPVSIDNPRLASNLTWAELPRMLRDNPPDGDWILYPPQPPNTNH